MTLFMFCACNELFFVALYLNKYYSQTIGIAALLPYVPPSILYNTPTLLLTALERLTWPQVIAVAAFPVCAGKQIINCVQFWKASKVLVESDQEERWEKLQGKKK